MRPTTLTAAVVAVAAGAALLVTVPGASSAAPTRSSAYGLAVDAGGQEVVPPSPTVESRDGSTQTTGGSIPPEAGPVLAGGVLGLSAGDDEASVEVTDLAIGGLISELPSEISDGLSQLQAVCEGGSEAPIEELPDVIGGVPLPLPEQPTEEELIEFCNGVFDGDQVTLATLDTLQVACDGDTGSVTLLGASVLGATAPLDLEDVGTDTELFPDNPLVSATLNRQSAGPRGSFTVDGLVVSLAGGEAEAVVASTTCGERIPQRQAPPAGDPDVPRAPVPAPQEDSAPVTG